MDTSLLENKDFITICIPWFNRAEYLNEVLSSFEEHADLPYEIIIHDDCSNTATREVLMSNSHRISSLILNNGKNIGLAASINRAVTLAGSEYIIFLNADCKIDKPFFRHLREVLKRPYIGFVNLSTNEDNLKSFVDTGYGRFSVYPGIGGGDAMAFTKSIFYHIDGFCDDIHPGCSDTPFMYRCYSNGYFRASLGEKVVTNIDKDTDNTNTTIIGKNFMSMPLLFGINQAERDKWLKEREDYCNKFWAKVSNIKESDLSDLDYWHNFSSQLIPKCGEFFINWEASYAYGHNNWREIIEQEVILKENSNNG